MKGKSARTGAAAGRPAPAGQADGAPGVKTGAKAGAKSGAKSRSKSRSKAAAKVAAVKDETRDATRDASRTSAGSFPPAEPAADATPGPVPEPPMAPPPVVTPAGPAVKPVERPLAALGAILTAGTEAPRRRSVGYSRFVAVMKWMLPAIAIVLIAVIASWPYMNPKTDLISIQSLIQGAVDAGGPNVVNARYVGSDDDGRPFTVSADKASNLSLDSQVIELTRPKADMSLDDGTWVFLTADAGRYDRADKELELTGAVDLFHDSGYEFRTTVAHVDLARGLAWGDAPVSGQGTFGVLHAEGFRLRNNEKTIRFLGKSKMTLYPSAGEPKS